MSDLNKDLSKKFLNYLDTKQYQRLQFEADMLGNIEDQHPVIIFYYASAIYLQESAKEKDLLYSSSLFEKVYNLGNNHLQSLYNMIAVSFKTKVFKSVKRHTLKAYEKNPNDMRLVEGLARIHFYLGNRNESIKLFRMLYKSEPNKTEGRLPFVSSLNYTSGVSQKEYLEECLNYANLLEKKLDIENDNYEFNNKKNDFIKIGFLSADFKNHSVSHFLKDILNKIDKAKFKVSLISNLAVSEKDKFSDTMKELSNNWYDVEHYTDNELTTFLRSLNFDILIDLSGFTQGNRLEVFARRCAKIQVVWLGYNNSLGIKNSDYLISDKNLVYEDELNLYREKIIFLPEIWNALSKPENLPEIDKQKEKNSNLTFCSFNNFQKISDRTINVWSRILKETNSRILLKDSLTGGDDLKENVLQKFLKQGVKEDQIIFLKREKKNEDHLKLYNKANVALDTFPYPGVTTSCEAILMGLPVLTMKGFNFNSRCGESIVKNINMDELIAIDDDDYVEKAKSLIFDKNHNEKYGEKLRDNALKSPLFDTDKFTKNFENLITEIFHKN